MYLSCYIGGYFPWWPRTTSSHNLNPSSNNQTIHIPFPLQTLDSRQIMRPLKQIVDNVFHLCLQGRITCCHMFLLQLPSFLKSRGPLRSLATIRIFCGLRGIFYQRNNHIIYPTFHVSCPQITQANTKESGSKS